jgi:hypothetical protein
MDMYDFKQEGEKYVGVQVSKMVGMTLGRQRATWMQITSYFEDL